MVLLLRVRPASVPGGTDAYSYGVEDWCEYERQNADGNRRKYSDNSGPEKYVHGEFQKRPQSL
jgi:hypothetical protein